MFSCQARCFVSLLNVPDDQICKYLAGDAVHFVLERSCLSFTLALLSIYNEDNENTLLNIKKQDKTSWIMASLIFSLIGNTKWQDCDREVKKSSTMNWYRSKKRRVQTQTKSDFFVYEKAVTFISLGTDMPQKW